MISLVIRALAMFDQRTTRRFVIVVAGSVIIALGEMLALLLVLPLMQLVTGDTQAGALPRLRDLLGEPGDGQLAAILAGAVIGGFLTKSLLAIAIRWWTLGFIYRRMVDASATLLRYYAHAPYSLHVQRGSADLLRRLNEGVSQVFGQVMTPAVSIATELITILSMSVVLLATAPIPALIIGLYFGIAFYVMQRLVKVRSRVAGTRIMEASLHIMRYAMQTIRGIKEIKLRNAQETFVQRYADAKMQAAMSQRTLAFLSEFPKYALETLFVIGVGLMTGLVYSNEPSDEALGVLAVFAVAGFRVMPSLVRMLASVNILRAGQVAVDLVEADMRAARDLSPDTTPLAARISLHHSVRVRDLTFRYAGADVDVLRGISLQVPAGSSLALVGRSGSGKSTLVDLVLGLQTPRSGTIEVDGVDVQTCLPAWQAGLAVVPQDVFVLDDTLRANVTFTPDTSQDEDRLWQCLEAAELREFAQSLPDGLETQMGEHGARLSGGQRQRVGIARALYRQPQLLVLDEATSALDNETEHAISSTVSRLRGDLSLIIVAHRLSTVRDCDQVAFLEDGLITALGTFDDVRSRSLGFERLVRLGQLTEGSTSPASLD